MTSTFSIISDLTLSSALALFEHLGAVSTDGPQPTDYAEPGLAGIVGFTGDGLSGTVVIAGTDSAVRTLCDREPGSQPRDWVGEMANQLVGRLKNQLLRRDCVVYVTTPIALSGSNLHVVPCPHTRTKVHTIEVDGQTLCVWLDVQFEPTLNLEEATTEIASEGDLMLF